MKKTVVSLVLVLALALGLFPVPALAANWNPGGNGNADNGTSGAAPWEYTPMEEPSGAATAAAVLTAGASSDTVSVTVKATDRATNLDVAVPGATVCLYVGTERKAAATTGADGTATLSLSGLSIEQRKQATISAYKAVASGTAINGTARDGLFRYFGEDGSYNRYTMELHSETIDTSGNWNGVPLPVSYESNKVDMVFVIDATGSMADEINNVKNNIAAFSESLIARGLDIRFSIIEYRDITCGEATTIHVVDGSHWYSDIDTITDLLQGITAEGGGDTPETVLDALGMVADGGIMQWRSDAYKFAFVLTDAGYKVDNNYGFESLEAVSTALKNMAVAASVITTGSRQGDYQVLYETTGGIYANIYGDFQAEMMNLADSVVDSTIRDVELKLSEPRMLVNLAVCYFADDATSQSAAYRESVKNMLNEYSHRLAETTDGHILIDKLILFSTDNRLDFYDTTQLASMADIRIESEEDDDGTWWFNVKIHNNSYPFGFFLDNTVTVDSDYMGAFTHLKDADTYLNRSTFKRILSGGVDINGYSMIDDVYNFSATQAHETGHYLMGFMDEYLDADGTDWRDSANSKPYGQYGLMDNQYADIEMSKTGIDYAYMTAGFSGTARSLHTMQSWTHKASCEDVLAELLVTDDASWAQYHYSTGPYLASYTKVSGTDDRHAPYSYAELTESDYVYIPGTGAGGGGGGSWGFSQAQPASTGAVLADTAVLTGDSLGKVTITGSGTEAILTLTPVDGYAYSLYIRQSGEAFAPVTLKAVSGGYTAALPVAKGQLAQVRLVAEKDGAARYNEYYVDRSQDTDTGYIYTAADNSVMAYVTAAGTCSYLFVADNTGYENGEYASVNQATAISGGMEGGEIYSVAAAAGEIDYTSISWFRCADGVWTRLATDLSEEENRNIGARADLQGEGLYVLMAKKPAGSEAKTVQDLVYTQSETVDALVTLHFTDPNANSKYYNVYYSDTWFEDKDADHVVMRTFDADGTDLSLNLLERDRRVYAAVEVVLEDGSRSPLSSIILIGGTADSDGDGIPDWYCDKYRLWPPEGEEKDIANSDDDGDGLTNYQEYLGGSDPTDPNDPVHTTNIPVERVSVEPACTLAVGASKTLAAKIEPQNATNQNVKWTSGNPGVAVVDDKGTVTAVAEGTAMITVTTLDGGFAAGCEVTVVEANPFVDLDPTRFYYEPALWAVKNGITNGMDATHFEPERVCTRAQAVTFLWRAAGCPEPEGTVNPFVDVVSGGFYYKAVLWAVENGITNGVDATHFEPQRTVTRSQLVTFLWRAAGEPSAAGSNPFVDVAAGRFYSQAVLWAVENGITSGVDATHFKPDANCTRGQTVTFLYRTYAE